MSLYIMGSVVLGLSEVEIGVASGEWRGQCGW